MWQLYQFPLCPFSRKVRLVLGEKGVGYEPVRESPWARRDEFLGQHVAIASDAVSGEQMKAMVEQVVGRPLTRVDKTFAELDPLVA